MDSLVLSTLLIQGVGIVATVVGLALLSCLPRQRWTRHCNWTSADPAAPKAKVDAAALPQAA